MSRRSYNTAVSSGAPRLTTKELGGRVWRAFCRLTVPTIPVSSWRLVKGLVLEITNWKPFARFPHNDQSMRSWGKGNAETNLIIL